MKFLSTSGKGPHVSARTAILHGSARDGGLFFPADVPSLSKGFFEGLELLGFHEIALEFGKFFLGEEIPDSELSEILKDALNFPVPLVELSNAIFSLELFHGPTLSFKDFGARTVARLMAHFRKNETKPLSILVATSGDTGSAVADGFYGIPGIEVLILFPKGRISKIQELQCSSYGGNIHAIEIDGSFDDCQSLVKSAFLDADVLSQRQLSSANSINIGRLLPQMFYYVEAVRALRSQKGRAHPPVVFSVPSGNLGNLTAGLMAKRMGLPISFFVAACNSNDVFHQYLKTGKFLARPSVRTHSNAMDVGNPSNFCRITAMYEDAHAAILKDIKSAAFSDSDTMEAIKEVFALFSYVIDPHGAVGYRALLECTPASSPVSGIILETAHPAKFLSVMDMALPGKTKLPQSLQDVMKKNTNKISLSNKYAEFKSLLLSDCFAG